MKKITSLISIWILIVVTCAGCAIRQNLETPFVPNEKTSVGDGSDDAHPSKGTKFCAPDAKGAFDTAAIPLTSGQLPAEGAAWAEGGGCVARPMRDVWAVLNNIDAMKFQAADRITYTRTPNPTPDFTHLYEITYFKGTIIGDIDWTIQWFHALLRGTMAAPEKVSIVYQRTKGTSNIPIWRGSLLLTKINDSMTSVAMRNEFKARQSSEEIEASARAALSEVVGNLRTVAPDYVQLDKDVKPPNVPSGGDDSGNGNGNGNGGGAGGDVPPDASKTYCIKDAKGEYPPDAQVTSSTNGLESRVIGVECFDMPVADVLTELKDHSKIYWKNTSSATVTSTTPTGDPFLVDHVTYAGKSPVKMVWNYHLAAGPIEDPDGVKIDYKLESPSIDYPVWEGTISVTRLDDDSCALTIRNDFLTDQISASGKENVSTIQKFLDDL